MPRLVTVAVALEDEVYELLRRAAEAERVPVHVLLERILRLYVCSREKKCLQAFN